ncbi:hypothetical protein BGZ94_004768 [Podila epigama]|nr:hypothetical protein BGZ94_004768 [Podila epigama]
MNNSSTAARGAQCPAQTVKDSQNSGISNGDRSRATTASHGGMLGTDTLDNGAAAHSSTLSKPLASVTQESYSPWDMPPIIHPPTTSADNRPASGCKGFTNPPASWPLFRSKPHPTISVPITPSTLVSRNSFDMVAPSTPPHSSFSNPEDSDNAMVTPTFGSSNSNYSRRNSTASVMALDTPPPLSLMELEASSTPSLSGTNFGAVAGALSNNTQGSHPLSMRTSESGLSQHHGQGYPFPLFGMRHDMSHSLSRRSSRTNSISMESRHVRKPSEDTNMSDGGNNSGSERGRRHSPAVVPFERSVRRSALLPKPKGLLKVFSQLEEEVHHNRHEYDHERETTQVRKGAPNESDILLMDIGVGATHRTGFPLGLGAARRLSSSRLNPEQELSDLQRQQEDYDKIYQMQQLQHLAQLQQQQHQQQQHSHPHQLQGTLPLDGHDIEPQQPSPGGPSSFMNHQMVSSPSSPLLAPAATRASKRKSSTCEERFEPYNSSHLKRRAVSPSLGPIISHRRSPSSSPARSHLAGHLKSKQSMMAPLSSPSGHGSVFRSHGMSSTPGLSLGGAPSGVAHGDHTSDGAANQPGADGAQLESDGNGHDEDTVLGPAHVTNSLGTAPRISSSLNLQHTSRSFSELSLNQTQ